METVCLDYGGARKWETKKEWIRPEVIDDDDEKTVHLAEWVVPEAVDLFLYLSAINPGIGWGFLRPLSPVEIRDSMKFMNEYVTEGHAMEMRGRIIQNVKEYMELDKVGAVEEYCGAADWGDDDIDRMYCLVDPCSSLHTFSKKTLSRMIKKAKAGTK